MKISKDYKYCLVGTINGLAEEVKRSRARISKGRTDIYRNAEAETKKFIGSEARHHLLAYAILNGTPYALIEKKCAEGNKPDPNQILDIMHRYIYSFEKKRYTVDTVNAWLKGEEVMVKPLKKLIRRAVQDAI